MLHPKLCLLIKTLAILYVTLSLGAKALTKDPEKPIPNEVRYSSEDAKVRAGLMNDIYLSTLNMLHHRYFHQERTLVPARAMEDVFSDIKKTSNTDARWLSINLKAMSFTHEPHTDFEKRAAREITNGKSEVEVIEDGFYRRVVAIPLVGGCLSCHEGVFKPSGKAPKFAALLISIPVKNAGK